MKVLKYESPGNATIIDVATPKPMGDEILAKSLFCNVSAGTEMGFYRGTAPQLNAEGDKNGNFRDKKGALAYPMQTNDPGVWWMGYANVSEVLEVGAEVKNIKKGDLVFANKGHQDWQLLKEEEATVLPPDINQEHASLVMLIEIAFNGILDGKLKISDNVVIFGLGTIGQLLVQMCKMSGCKVIAVDCLENRLETARKSDADAVLNFKEEDIAERVYELTDGAGADVVYEVSGNVRALSEAIRASGYNSRVVVVSFYQSAADTLFLGKEFHHKRTQLISSQIGALNPELSGLWDYARRRKVAVELVSKLDIEPLISHRFDFDNLPKALKIIDKNPSECNAVSVKY